MPENSTSDVQSLPGRIIRLRPQQRSNTIPAPGSSIIGRNGEIETTMSLIDDSGVRIITLVGPGGVGKTRLALEVARTVRRAAAREVAYIELAAVRDANHVLQTIAQTLAIPRSPDNSALSRIEEVLRDLDILLVLDNFEHLLGASEVLVDILTACPRICMLVTSRSVLKVSGEHVV